MKVEKLKRATKRYDDDEHKLRYWVETDAACGCYYGGESSLPKNDHTSNGKWTLIGQVRGENTCSSASCEAGWIRSSMVLSACQNLKLRV